MQQTLKSYLKRLTNLTGNNRSLLLIRLIQDQFIDLHKFNRLHDTSFAIIEGLIASKSSIPLCEEVDPRDEDANTLSKQLKKLHRNEKFFEEERGSKDLYVGWPFVRGKFNDGTLVRCPLLFFPVTLYVKKNQWTLQPRKDVNITFNKTFLIAYGHFNEVNVSDDLLEKVIEEFDTDSTVFRTSLYQELKESNINVHFNQVNFTDKLHSFLEISKKDFDLLEKNGQLKLFPEAILGIFPQSGSHLMPDYNQIIAEGKYRSMEDFFESKTQQVLLQSVNQRQIKEEQIFTTFHSDAYQENALKSIKSGRSMVIQGPPGTGKSQLICNIISDSMATGKKVLVVCQKKAALDVVYHRLKEKELSNFIGLVHDFKNDRKAVYQKISSQIESIPDYKLKNRSLDAIQLERSFLQNSRKIDQITEELAAFKAALYDHSECGLSVKELYLTSNIDKPSISLTQEYREFHFDTLTDFVDQLKQYIFYALKINQYEHPFYNRKSFGKYTFPDLQQMLNIIENVPIFKAQIEKNIKELTQVDLVFEDIENMIDKQTEVNEMLQIIKNPSVYNVFINMTPYLDSATDMLWISNNERVMMECFKGHGPEKSLKSEDLGKFQEALEQSIQARKGLVKYIKWKLLSKDKYLIKRVLVANKIKPSKEGLKVLVKKIDNRLNFEHNLTKLKKQKWLSEFPTTLEKGQVQNWFHINKLALKAKLIYKSLRNFQDHFNIFNYKYTQLTKLFDNFFDKTKEIANEKNKWLFYFTEIQLKHITQNINYRKKITKVLKNDFDSICEFDKLLDDLSYTQHEVVKKLFDADEHHNEDTIISLFDNSIRLAWIEHIEKKHPELRTVSSQKLHQLELQLQQAIERKMDASNEILHLKAHERTYEELEYNRLNNMVTYRDLAHQVNKKRRIWPIRKLIAHHHQELFQLIPCWMASPESVSTIFPLQSIFDIVIFDEASQCFVEKGIPAMCRGKQVVITGDNKQLRPNDLYRPRFDDDSQEGIDMEVESLLELAESYLMQTKLQRHYRSKALELIDFSNKHFYDNQLRLLPDRKDMNIQLAAIRYLNVSGCWEKNTNIIEAQKVVEILVEQVTINPKKDIGVITFNIQQRDLINDLFEERLITQKIATPENFFIKNIENVQGDEKDIIIFSTAYAPDSTGKMNMKFGSLNKPNGGNRLNVAVTRAREQVIVVTSIYPHQLQVDHLKNQGPKLLKSYLNYALEVSEGRFEATIHPNKMSSASWYLKDQLVNKNTSRNVSLTHELPFGDITIKNKNNYLGVILTDDNLYYQNESIKDAHANCRFNLSEKNWNYKEIYSRQYWSNKEEVLESIRRFIKQQENQ